VLVEPALYAIYPPDKMPPEVERLHKVVVPLFHQGLVEEGWHAFIGTIFPNRTMRPVPEEDLDTVRASSYDLQSALIWCPSSEELRRFTQPVLILHGDQSPLFLRNISHRLHSQLIGSKLVTLLGQGHGMTNAAPKLVAEQIRAFAADYEPQA
jgi:pimeloyl-ACP methyl ester carboxylesterase